MVASKAGRDGARCAPGPVFLLHSISGMAKKMATSIVLGVWDFAFIRGNQYSAGGNQLLHFRLCNEHCGRHRTKSNLCSWTSKLFASRRLSRESAKVLIDEASAPDIPKPLLRVRDLEHT